MRGCFGPHLLLVVVLCAAACDQKESPQSAGPPPRPPPQPGPRQEESPKSPEPLVTVELGRARLKGECKIEQVIGDRNDGLILARACDGNSFTAARYYDGGGDVLATFTRRPGEEHPTLPMVFGDGLEKHPSLLPWLPGHKFRPSVWLVDVDAGVAIDASTRESVALVSVEDALPRKPTEKEPSLWAIYSDTCPGSRGPCVFTGSQRALCQRVIHPRGKVNTIAEPFGCFPGGLNGPRK